MTSAGAFRFKDRLLFIAKALQTHRIGLEEAGAGVWSIYLGPALLARLDERDHLIRGCHPSPENRSDVSPMFPV